MLEAACSGRKVIIIKLSPHNSVKHKPPLVPSACNLIRNRSVSMPAKFIEQFSIWIQAPPNAHSLDLCVNSAILEANICPDVTRATPRRMKLDGVIKFRAEHETNVCCRESDILELTKWRNELRAAGMVGQDVTRYGGLGFGNLSKRMEDGTFLITASQTGHLDNLTSEHYARIADLDPDQNRVRSRGLNPPSSETMTHLAVYGSIQAVQFVFHVHCPEIWNAKADLDLLVTDPAVECGTVEMFYEVRRLLKIRDNARRGILAMGGHTDGLLAWARTADETGFHLLSLLSQATRLFPPASGRTQHVV